MAIRCTASRMANRPRTATTSEYSRAVFRDPVVVRGRAACPSVSGRTRPSLPDSHPTAGSMVQKWKPLRRVTGPGDRAIPGSWSRLSAGLCIKANRSIVSVDQGKMEMIPPRRLQPGRVSKHPAPCPEAHAMIARARPLRTLRIPVCSHCPLHRGVGSASRAQCGAGSPAQLMTSSSSSKMSSSKSSSSSSSTSKSSSSPRLCGCGGASTGRDGASGLGVT